MNLYAYWLKGADNGAEKLKPVHYYVMGDTADKECSRQLLAIRGRVAASLREHSVLSACGPWAKHKSAER